MDLQTEIVADLYAAAKSLDDQGHALGCLPDGETSQLADKLRKDAGTLQLANRVDERVSIKLAEEYTGLQSRLDWLKADNERLALALQASNATVAKLRNELHRFSTGPAL